MKLTSDKITMTLYYNCQPSTTLICDQNEKLETILKNYANQIEEDFGSLIFLYDGQRIEDVTKPIQKIIRNSDYNENQIIVLCYKIETIIYGDTVKINFILNSNALTQRKESRHEKLEKICRDYARAKSLKFDSLLFKYGGKEIDLSKDFDGIANPYDKQCLGMTIEVYYRNELKVNFLYKNKQSYTIKCFKEDKVSNIINDYISKNSLDNNNLIFYYGNNPIKIQSNQTFIQLITDTEDRRSFDTLIVRTDNFLEKKKNEINIKVKDQEPIPERNVKMKIIISIFVILIIAVIVFLIIYFTKSKKKLNDSLNDSQNDLLNDTSNDSLICSLEGCEICNDNSENNECILCNDDFEAIYDNNQKIIKCNRIYETSCDIGYKLVNGKCKVDYLIKVTYLTNTENQRINNLFNFNYVNYISRMIIDGKDVDPCYAYNFPNKGYHTVYYKFKESSSPSSNELFFNCTEITEVSFSNFNEYVPFLSFQSLFIRCTQLTSVDLSKISFGSNRKYRLESMFKNCSNLKYVNFNLKKNLVLESTVKNMFCGCKSLLSVDLSKLDFKDVSNFENMFYDCNSLSSINLTSVYLKSANNIDSMFYNCFSLTSLDLSGFKPDNLRTMENVFSNCAKLSYLGLNQFYTHNVNSMKNLFYNCSSLTSIELSSFNTRNVVYFQNMFAYCSSLTSIDITNFITNNTRDISGMFLHCHSLTSIDLTNFVIVYQNNMNDVFSHCYSLKTIDLQNFNMNAKNFESMFSHCYSLERVIFNNNKNIKFLNVKKMFYGCYSLTSVDLSMFYDYDFSCRYTEIFYDCPNLNYVNIQGISITYNDNYMFNNNISSSGTLIINKDFYDNYNNKVPSNWIINTIN